MYRCNMLYYIILCCIRGILQRGAEGLSNVQPMSVYTKYFRISLLVFQGLSFSVFPNFPTRLAGPELLGRPLVLGKLIP